ncbi:hypothetical protein GGP72_001287 [Salinibacter ruber]|uniref:Uncharacterized protein n=1 Tax=Salinibacter ruber TaxID=146919 RepID=A0A9X2TBI7_9BACT|nr:hypothetical protein [Salinibacter ruber]MCS3677370.1 hypothetical protein [Salinibacter ruber]MCS3680658.1 hypothetical protein [Salinibacter ruber]
MEGSTYCSSKISVVAPVLRLRRNWCGWLRASAVIGESERLYTTREPSGDGANSLIWWSLFVTRVTSPVSTWTVKRRTGRKSVVSSITSASSSVASRCSS